MSDAANWYVVHTNTGFENKVKSNLEKAVENRNMENLVLEIKVPTEEVVEETDGKKKVVTRKVFPSYVFIKMIMTDESWYVVRNTRGVTGFVGPGSKAVPLTEDEVGRLGIEYRTIKIAFEVGDSVRITDGPFENVIGVVEEINMEKQNLLVIINMFGREQPVELAFNQIEQLVSS